MGLLNKNKQLDTQTVNYQSTTNLTDYNIYIMPFKERLLYIFIAAASLFAVGYIFYHSFILAALLCPFALLYPRIKKADIIERRKYELNVQFKDMLYSLSSSLSAGKSIELAFRDVLKDLAILYPNPDTPILTEVECIIKRLEMNETIEEAVSDFARRSHLEDVENFVDVFYISKRAGGNIVDIIKNSSNIISDKLEIKEEIETLLAQRKFEQKVLNLMPIGLIILLSATAADYMAPVFDSPMGRIAMTASIVLLIVAYFISKKIMSIKV